MLRRFIRRSLTAAGTLAVLAVLFVPSLRPESVALADGAVSETHLNIAGPADVPLGNQARILVLLEDGEGEPVPDAEIVFTSPATLGGAVAEMDLGSVTTGPDGIALFDYELRIQGDNRFIARYYGDGDREPSEASITIAVTGTAQLTSRTAGIDIPFFGGWFIVALLGVVWGVYFLAVLLIAQIPEPGFDSRKGGAS